MLKVPAKHVEDLPTEQGASDATYLAINALECGYGEKQVINDISFSLQRGDIGCLLGPSGCGKTTVLRSVAGFVPLQAGEILVKQRVLSKPDYAVPPEKRNLGMVYQDYALFPHLNVEQNICFGIRNQPEEKRKVICSELLTLIQMQGYESRHPAELSGGQQQRVALARSLAVKPDILLLDEPFSGLDVELRRELSISVRDILKQRGTTALLVTHDQEEAFAVADQVGVMRSGELLQWDTAYNLYHQPGHRFVADFIGRGSFIRGQVQDSNTVTTELGAIHGHSQQPFAAGQQVELLIRPDDLFIDDRSEIRGTIINKLFIGTNTLYALSLKSGAQIEIMLPSHEDYALGSEHGLRVEAPHLITFELD